MHGLEWQPGEGAISWAFGRTVRPVEEWPTARSITARVSGWGQPRRRERGGKGTVSVRVAPPLKRICAMMLSAFGTVTSSMRSRATRFRSRDGVRGSCPKRATPGAQIASRSVALSRICSWWRCCSAASRASARAQLGMPLRLQRPPPTGSRDRHADTVAARDLSHTGRAPRNCRSRAASAARAPRSSCRASVTAMVSGVTTSTRTLAMALSRSRPGTR